MLILSRKNGQQINIGENISITVTSVSGSRVKLGIDAPDSVKIVRSEVAGQNLCSFTVDPELSTKRQADEREP